MLVLLSPASSSQSPQHLTSYSRGQWAWTQPCYSHHRRLPFARIGSITVYHIILLSTHSLCPIFCASSIAFSTAAKCFRGGLPHSSPLSLLGRPSRGKMWSSFLRSRPPSVVWLIKIEETLSWQMCSRDRPPPLSNTPAVPTSSAPSCAASLVRSTGTSRRNN